MWLIPLCCVCGVCVCVCVCMRVCVNILVRVYGRVIYFWLILRHEKGGRRGAPPPLPSSDVESYTTAEKGVAITHKTAIKGWLQGIVSKVSFVGFCLYTNIYKHISFEISCLFLSLFLKRHTWFFATFLSAYICICIWTYMCTYIVHMYFWPARPRADKMPTHVKMRCTSLCIYVYIYVYGWMLCLYIYTCMYMAVCCAYIYTYMYMPVCKYIYYIHIWPGRPGAVKKGPHISKWGVHAWKET